ncbi:mitochondrial import inner membrane translocase subunit TIM8 isoform X1 [Amborella trichopoda]|uniref:mitochondrial import inner membrane translocase subunit TIM8 isoform X1 n=1 Tax=Amborella trichopoda TaxID=13333 RepID=UPI0009BE54A9|nr:mitochondrial import inner membrane translocase subunit TIM8 isoform X1 [Amborella trichopoda]|eukprot:XP_020518049.1 mitochondrial import inner membrane translocase subunit TIM8 isoform X1 [Amborella trichopoda]
MQGMTSPERLITRKCPLQEQQRAMVNQMVAKLTDVCWDKCVTGSVGSSFSHSEVTCLSNCAQRYMELSMLTVQRFKSNGE